jgi:hypothetical protein
VNQNGTPTKRNNGGRGVRLRARVKTGTQSVGDASEEGAKKKEWRICSACWRRSARGDEEGWSEAGMLRSGARMCGTISNSMISGIV